MHDVSEHHSKKEWESNDRENSGISLLVSWDSVSVYDHLENIEEFVVVELGGSD